MMSPQWGKEVFLTAYGGMITIPDLLNMRTSSDSITKNVWPDSANW